MNQEMPTFDISSIPQDFSPLQTLGNGPDTKLYDGDDRLYVTFKTEPVLNPAASTKAGRPIYDDIDMITIHAPGSKLTSVVDHAKRYTQGRPVLAAKYRDWKSGQVASAGGTPLENFPFLFTKPSMIAELKYRNIFTVEQLATLTDSGKQTIMGGHELCQKAADWIASTAANAADEEKEVLKQRLAKMEEEIAMLTGDKPKQPRGKRIATAHTAESEPMVEAAPESKLPEFLEN
jgi:hypothetical protein